MKKNYFMLAAATMMFAACAETDLLNEVNMEEAPKAIEFETFAQKATRAEITNSTLQTVGFQVWGYKYPSNATIVWEDVYTEVIDETTGETKLDSEGKPVTEVTTPANIYPVFEEVAVTYSNSTWGYTDKQYWDQASNYKFYAIAPQKSKDFYGFSKGKFTVSNVESKKATESDDYVIAAEVTKVGKNKEEVEFTFSHIMSKLSFILKAGVDETISVTSLTMSGWNSGKGTFTEGNEDGEWKITTTANDGCPIIDTGNNTNAAAITKSSSSVVGYEYIMVPQAIAKETLKFNITYTIDGETFTQEALVETAQTWAKNTHYTYTITISPAAIEFGVQAVNGWTVEKNNDGTNKEYPVSVN